MAVAPEQLVETQENNFDASQIWFYKRTLKALWTAKVNHPNIFKEAQKERQLITIIRMRQSFVFDHIMIREK